MEERVGVAGSGEIASGLAALATRHGPVLMWARSYESAERARDRVRALCRKLDGHDPEHLDVVHDLAELEAATFVVEAVVEELDTKVALLEEMGRHLGEHALLATTTSSLSVAELGRASGRPESFVGLHVFNPVTRMKLVELILLPEATEETRARALELCRALEKTPVEVPDIPGFVVNRLLFPYLFGAVRLVEETGMKAEDVDTCMTLGAGHPMGPLALLDLVGLDVAAAIGESIGEPVPARLAELVHEGALGRKTGRGFHTY